MADGWIKLWRKLADSPMWLEKPFSKGQAWVDLLLLATASDHISKYKGKNKAYIAGTVHFSLLSLSERWGWSRNKVYRFVEKLQKDGMIEYQSRTSNGTINRTEIGAMCGTINDTTNDTINDTFITVVNWALYQSRQTKNDTINGTINETTNGATDGTTKRTSNGTHPKKDIHKNDISKEKKNTKKKTSPPPPCGVGDVPKAVMLKPIDEGTVDDIPEEFRDFCSTYADYWRFRNR